MCLAGPESVCHRPPGVRCEAHTRLSNGVASDNSLGGVEKAGEEKVRQLVPLCTHVVLILIGGGFPCPAYSRLKAGNQGHQGDMQMRHIERLALLFKKVLTWATVKRFYENVQSTSDEEATWLTADINRNPSLGLLDLIEMDGDDLGPSMRRRYYWIDAGLAAKEREAIPEDDEIAFEVNHKAQTRLYRWRLMCPEKPNETNWLESGCEPSNRRPDAVITTFTRPTPRKKPPQEPAELNTCDQAARDRWQADRFRYPPYRYKEENLIRTQARELRAPTAPERERALMYLACITLEREPMKNRGRSVELEDLWNAALGNGFHCGCVSILLNRCSSLGCSGATPGRSGSGMGLLQHECPGYLGGA